jgi:hypothetical protein
MTFKGSGFGCLLGILQRSGGASIDTNQQQQRREDLHFCGAVFLNYAYRTLNNKSEANITNE